MVRGSILRMACLAAAVLLAACGGGDSSEPAGALRARAPLTAPVFNATVLMDWGEQHYPQYFPEHAADQAGPSYTHRHYSNGNYLAITSGGDIYVVGPTITGGDIPVWVGPMADYKCIVVPALCAGGSVSGTAAAGGALAGRTVTLKDSAGVSVTTTTSAAGTFTFSTGGLTGPYLLRSTTATGTVLYSVTAAATGTLIANITPITDLMVRSWYGVQGASTDAAFANPAAFPAPGAVQVRALANAVLPALQWVLARSSAGVTTALDLIEMPFTADHTGMDAALDAMNVTHSGGAAISAQVDGTSQSTTIAYDASTHALAVSSTASGGSNTSISGYTAVVPVTSAELAAWSGIEAGLASFAGTINTRGAALAVADLTGYLDPALLDDGRNQAQLATSIVSSFGQGQSVAMELQRADAMDLVSGRVQARVRVAQSLGSQSALETMQFDFHLVDGAWLLAGNQRVAAVSLYAEGRLNQGAYTQGSGPSINVDIRPPQGTVSAVAVTTSAGGIGMVQGPTAEDDSGLLLDSFFGNTGPIPGILPPAGTPFTVTLTRSGGGTSTVVIPLNAFTTETAPITSPTGTTLADAHLGSTLGVAWQLPVTYAIAEVRLSALVFTGNQSSQSTFQCEADQPVLGTTATAGELSIPATCHGLPVTSVNINLTVNGVNGERSQTIYLMRN